MKPLEINDENFVACCTSPELKGMDLYKSFHWIDLNPHVVNLFRNLENPTYQIFLHPVNFKPIESPAASPL